MYSHLQFQIERAIEEIFRLKHSDLKNFQATGFNSQKRFLQIFAEYNFTPSDHSLLNTEALSILSLKTDG